MKRLTKIGLGFALCFAIVFAGVLVTGCGKKKEPIESPQTQTTSYIGQTVKAAGENAFEDKYVKLINETQVVITLENMALLGTYTGSDGVYQLSVNYYGTEDNLIVRTFNYIFGENGVATVTETTVESSTEFIKLTPTTFVKIGDKEVQTGLWVGFAAMWDEEMYIYGEDVGGESTFTYFLEDGRCFSADGLYQSYEVKFVVAGDVIIQYSFNAFGELRFASLFYYDDSCDEFDFPVVYSAEDGEKYFEKYLPKDEFKFDFVEGSFEIKFAGMEVRSDEVEFEEFPLGITIETEDKKLDFVSKINATGTVTLSENGNATVAVNFEGTHNSTGKWYNLNDGLLIVLNTPNEFLGQFFSIIANFEQDFERVYDPGVFYEEIIATPTTEIRTTEYYKVGTDYYEKDTTYNVYYYELSDYGNTVIKYVSVSDIDMCCTISLVDSEKIAINFTMSSLETDETFLVDYELIDNVYYFAITNFGPDPLNFELEFIGLYGAYVTCNGLEQDNELWNRYGSPILSSTRWEAFATKTGETINEDASLAAENYLNFTSDMEVTAVIDGEPIEYKYFTMGEYIYLYTVSESTYTIEETLRFTDYWNGRYDFDYSIIEIPVNAETYLFKFVSE